MIPSLLGIFTARHFIIPNLPQKLVFISIDKALVVLLLTFMSAAGYFMIKDSPVDLENHSGKNQMIKVTALGLSLGIIMGLLGAGGGFLIIPTLVLLMGFSMQKAIPTSLFIITVNSLVGFTADRHHFVFADYINLGKYLVPALLGMTIGLYISKFLKREGLKKAFGYFIWIVGMAIFIKEFILL